MERIVAFLASRIISEMVSKNDVSRRTNLMTRDKLRKIALSFAWTLAFVAQMTTVCVSNAGAASDLNLALKLSFDDDSSPNFPIQGQNLANGSIASGEATVIFFGTSNCWNTAREAERLVKLYSQFHNRIQFVIVDLHNVAPAQEEIGGSLLPWLHTHDHRDR